VEFAKSNDMYLEASPACAVDTPLKYPKAIGSGEVPVFGPAYLNVLPRPAAMLAARFAWAFSNSARKPFSTMFVSL